MANICRGCNTEFDKDGSVGNNPIKQYCDNCKESRRERIESRLKILKGN